LWFDKLTMTKLLTMTSKNEAMRRLPPVHRFLSDGRITAFETLLGKNAVKRSINETLERERATRSNGAVREYDALVRDVVERLQLAACTSLQPVINGSGILLHTNLGRAPIAESALEAIRRIGSGYSNIEYDLEKGVRGSRYARARTALQEVTSAQDGLVVNNCAAAVLLILDTFAKGREVIVARNQLIEVGGGFRLPDVLERSGATLVEVGATNKVYLRDFERALSPRTALILRSHPSNYRITGFTHDVDARELVALGKRAGIPVVEDLGSGAVVDFEHYGLPHERTVQEAIADGVDLVTFSGDKVLGGPQAGIIAGSKQLVARVRNNPLMRALRVDKLTFAALIETLRLYASPESRAHIPLFRMLGATVEELHARAARYCSSVTELQIVETTAYVGGGSLPERGVPSVAVSYSKDVDALAAALRRGTPPIVARVESGKLLIDLRSVLPEQDPQVIAALQHTLA
jgi:L-seryl-tRNA(Ser) seleniumtransferase